MIMGRKQWTVAGAMLAVAVSAAVGILCARGHVRSRNGPGAAVEHESVEKVTVRLLREPIATTAFAATTLDGRSISSADWRGKIVLVNFWATWCPPCRPEIPDLIALQEKYRDHLVIVGIAEDEGSVDGVKRFVAEHKINYPIVMSTPELRKIFPAVMALRAPVIQRPPLPIGLNASCEPDRGEVGVSGLSRAERSRAQSHCSRSLTNWSRSASFTSDAAQNDMPPRFQCRTWNPRMARASDERTASDASGHAKRLMVCWPRVYTSAATGWPAT
jgi:thiol-disulfide isomerase/thioredoxin